MREIQRSILDYANKNKYLSIAVRFAEIMLLIYPTYLLLIKITALISVWGIIGKVSSVFYVCYVLGAILTFAKNRWLFLDAAFLMIAFNRLLSFRFSITFNQFVYLGFYLALAAICIMETRKSNQFEEVISLLKAIVRKISQKGNKNQGQDYFEHRTMNENPELTGSFIFCDQCGQKLSAGSKFCGNCGSKIDE